VFNYRTPPNSSSGFATLLTSRHVTWIRMSTSSLINGGYEHITDLGGDSWRATKAEVIRDIRSGWTYYTREDGTVAPLEIDRTVFGFEYVRTRPDCTRANNLLSLPRR
jgi:hypothetical protein